VPSSVARALALSAACLCLVSAANVAQAQLIESPLDSEEAKEEGLPFRGSSFGFYQTMTGNTFGKDTQLSYNPYYAWAFDLNLLWHFNRRFQVILNQGLNVELTSSDLTLYRREPRLTDTSATFGALLLKTKTWNDSQFILNGSLGVIAPTSLVSQASTMTLGTRVGLTSTLSFPKILDGLGLSAAVGYLHRFLRSNVVAVGNSGFACDPGVGSSSREFCTALGGPTNAQLAVNAGFSSEIALTDKWGLSASFTHTWRRAADLKDATFITSDGADVPLADGSLRHWRNLNMIDLTVTYFATGWLGLGASVTNLFAERGPDSAIRPPLRPMDTYFGLNVNLRLDELYLAVNPPSKTEDE
jgi:hypothetical protein